MKAIVQDKYGRGRGRPALADIERPQIGADEVLLRVHVGGLDRQLSTAGTSARRPAAVRGVCPSS
jgi:hypothetical protein